jgi:NADH-quinone oxidoreductase subunit B
MEARVVRTDRGAVALLDLALACCALESARAPWADSDEEPTAVALCLSGTITDKLAPLVEAAISDLGERFPGLPVYRVAVGACASSGGPYWDSPSVRPGHQVDLMVPGCPPAPQAIADAILSLGVSR